MCVGVLEHMSRLPHLYGILILLIIWWVLENEATYRGSEILAAILCRAHSSSLNIDAKVYLLPFSGHPFRRSV